MISFIKSAKSINDFPETYREVVFVGRSNVGKSSLLNALFQKDLAFVGKTPGKTRLINFFDIDGKYTAVDVPGYGFANRNMDEQIAFGDIMDSYFYNRKQIKLVVCIFDGKIGQTSDDDDMVDFLKENKLPFIVVFNKIDKLNQSQMSKLKNEKFKFLISCKTKKGIYELKDYIEKKVLLVSNNCGIK